MAQQQEANARFGCLTTRRPTIGNVEVLFKFLECFLEALHRGQAAERKADNVFYFGRAGSPRDFQGVNWHEITDDKVSVCPGTANIHMFARNRAVGLGPNALSVNRRPGIMPRHAVACMSRLFLDAMHASYYEYPVETLLRHL